MTNNFKHNKIEAKWGRRWEKEGLYSPNLGISKNSFYNLFMFPYPSAEGLHAGHAFASTGSDVYGRFMRMQGRLVFQPIGYDSFGIHSENFALTISEHPQKMIQRTTKNYAKQLKSLGHGYDWNRTVTTSDIDYYRWTQWIFVQLFKAGLAFRKKADVNWCPSCKTVLSDEQVVAQKPTILSVLGQPQKSKDYQGSVCERCGSVVEKRELEQWFFRITDYADKLLEGLTRIDWPEKIKITQRNWIGRSEGATIRFQFSVVSSQLSDSGQSVNRLSDKQSLPLRGRLKTGKLQSDKQSLSLSDNRKPKTDNRFIEVFTTRPDTLYGATFLAVSPNSPLAVKILDSTPVAYKLNVSKYIKEHTFKGGSLQGTAEKNKQSLFLRNKSGEFTGVYAINPATNEEIPVWIADYVLMDYGTGAIMGVPAHDERDFEFAKKFDLQVADTPPDMSLWQLIEKEGWGNKTTSYHLRDWLISRQRYWGPPIPMIYCEKCAKEGKSWFTKSQLSGVSNQLSDSRKSDNLLTENRKPKTENRNKLLHHDQTDWNHTGWWPEENLPVELPYMKNYQPKGTGRGPLAASSEFYQVACPECDSVARRETDVSDTFLDSSWYFLRYPSVDSEPWTVNSGNSSNKSKHRTPNTVHRTLPWDPEITKNWLPVDLYFGGAEHAVLHLMYARFVWKVLYDLGYLNFPAKSSKEHLGGPATMPIKALGWDEPFPRLFAHGLMIKDGAKMSKSKGNVVNPDEYVEKYGADTLRLYLMFMGPMDGYPDFRDTGIEGMRRFIEKVWSLFQTDPTMLKLRGVDRKNISIKMHQTIKKVTEDIQKFHYNTAISAIMEYVNLLREKVVNSEQWTVNSGNSSNKSKHRTPNTLHRTQNIRCAEWDEALKVLAQLIAPFAPFIAEEIWVEVLGEKFSIHTSAWPKFVPELVNEEYLTIAVQVDGKLRATLALKAENSPASPSEAGRAKLKDEVIETAKTNPKIQKWLKGKTVIKKIFVPGKLVNFVTN